jgi:hypothetical protein
MTLTIVARCPRIGQFGIGVADLFDLRRPLEAKSAPAMESRV